MASFKSHPFFVTSLILAGALTAGQAWLIFSQRSSAKKIGASIEQKEQTLQKFNTARPFPSRANLEAVEADLAAVQKIRADIRERLHATGEVAERIKSATIPVSSTDAYFDVATFVERVRAKVAAASETAGSPIEVGADNRFGFSAYRTTGPASDLVAPVFKQRLYTEYFIDTLLANPSRALSSIVSIQRERPLSAVQKRQIAEALASGQSAPNFGDGGGGGSGAAVGDYFSIDPRTSARVEGFVETMPFRITFVGFTPALRDFLNELATFKIPVVVRSVEVDPVNPAQRGGQAAAAPKPQSMADLFGSAAASAEGGVTKIEDKEIVPKTESRFTVTLEVISLVEKPADAALTETAPTP